MIDLRTMLMSSVAAISLAAAPALAQDAAPQTEGAETQEMAQDAPAERSFDQTYGENLAGLGDRNVEELVGTRVVNEAGETLGEVGNFGLSDDNRIVAIVGIGGFLGIGEHNVALPMDSMSFDGEQLVLSGVSREELEALPEYDEANSEAFAADQTLRGGYEGTGMPGMTAGSAPTETAATQPSDNPAADEPMMSADEEVAEASEAETGADAEMAEAEATEDAVEQAGEDIAQAAEETGEAVEGAGEEMAQTADEAGDAVEAAGAEAANEMAEATDEMAAETEQATESAEATDGTGQPADTEMAASDDAATTEGAEQPETDMAASGDAATTGGAEEGADMAASDDAGWTEEMDTIFADIADRQIAELIGMEVASADGDVVGEVDNFALTGEDVVAIVGIGGFLGIGEHEVALRLDEMTYDGEKLVLSSMTEEQLREMPEYDEAEPNYLPEDGTLRGTYDR